MAVLQIASNQRCKLCKSPRRLEMDALLEMRSNGESDKAGNRVNFEYVAAQYAAWHADAAKPADRKLTEENVKGHWKNHCEKVTPEEAGALAEAEAKTNEAKAAIFDRVLGEGWQDRPKSPDEYLEVLREIACHPLGDHHADDDRLAPVLVRRHRAARTAPRRGRPPTRGYATAGTGSAPSRRAR